MRNAKFFIFLFSLFFSLCAQASFAEENCAPNGIDVEHANQFIAVFKTYLNQNKPKKIADMATFPLRINDSSIPNHIRTFYVKSKTDFLKRYPAIFTKSTIAAINNDLNLFCNYQGAAFGSGTIWFQATKKDAKFFVVNVAT